MPRVTTEDADVVAAEDVDVRTPDGKRLIRGLSLRLEPGDGLLIKGPSGSGKTVLLQTVAGLWPYTSGVVRYPIAARETMLGDPRAVTSYPSPEGTVDDESIQGALLTVALPHLIIRINEVKDWAKVLSVGEQQLIVFARILLNRPKAVFLDESTSAMDEGLESMLYRLIHDELPDTIVVSVSHASGSLARASGGTLPGWICSPPRWTGAASGSCH
ncbi:ATP-binding cassette domain-containing protein [Mycolicibacterium sp. P9-64]|uniref:ATP-binding cassette domain-containing protein n=1 Tax=Mycolicibacterium sp. P9-64 TaxID=2024612 RepID=UPI001F5BA49D|nr:ATP-binding cassette domain-containing protein [Mycolicibacterium sp. P9-64]